ncbi:contractile injection system tape measure protein [Flavobacterium sp. DGU11]|uniref:Contractile injection system tape measure protein n=1 Tax=Flavobacterium arundinis TaxID=3139143 RepID=A0ABU9HSK7_9FLAO
MNSVGKISLDLKGEDQNFFQGLYGDVNNFLSAAIEKPTDEVVAFYDKDAEHVEIGTIELDLGPLTKEDFTLRFAAIYREKLYEMLGLYIVNPIVYGVKKVTKQKQLSEILFHFLRYGSLPWDIDKKYKDIDNLFFEVVRHESAGLKKFLQTYGHYTSLQRRLVFQLGDNALEEGINLIAPGEGSFVLSYIRFLHAKYKVTETQGISERHHRDMVWQVVYAYLLNNKSSFFSIRGFLKYTIAALAAMHGISYSHLLKIITYELEVRYRNELVRSELYIILGELKNEASEVPVGRSLTRMARMYISVVSAQRESPQWKNNKNILEDILKKQDTCQAFLQHLAEAEITGLVKIIIPEEHSFVLGYTKSLERQKETGLLQGKAGGEFRLLKWQIIFPILLQSNSSGFNRKYFILQTLQRIASRYNFHINEILVYIITSAKEKLLLDKTLVSVLEQLYKEVSGDRALPEKSASSRPDEGMVLDHLRTGKELDTVGLRQWRKVMADTGLREKILGQLRSEKQHTAFIKMLFPLEADIIPAYAGGLDLYNKQKALEGKAGGSFVQMKWKFIHAALFEPQQNVFNKKYFVERVLTRISAHYNLKVQELLEFFYREIVTAGNTFPFELIKVLRELYNDKVKIIEGGTKQKEKQQESLTPEQKARERLQYYFGNDTALAFLIERLAKVHEFVNFIDEGLRIGSLLRKYFINELNIDVDAKAVLKLIARSSHGYSSLTRAVVMRRILLYYTSLVTDKRKAMQLEQKLGELSRTNALVKETLEDMVALSTNFGKSKSGLPEGTPIKQDEMPLAGKGMAEFINNAGLVLLHPYLPRLFAMLSLTVDGKFTGEDAQFRAIFLMQYAVFGSTEFPEHEMRLNKLMAGVGQDVAIPGSVELTLHEKETIDGLLNAVINAWSKLGKTSVEGLRGAFLVRDGKIDELDDLYQLVVEEKTFDILLGSLPWSISTIKYSWMEKGINVKWR